MAVDELSEEEHARLTDNADRITLIATEVGQSALLSVVQGRLLVEELENAYARSLWIFLNEPDSFWSLVRKHGPSPPTKTCSPCAGRRCASRA
jgi:hypothetical protein